MRAIPLFIIALFCGFSERYAKAQDSFWPKEQILFEGREYELKSAEDRTLICRVVRYMGDHLYEVETPKEWKWGSGGGTARGTRQGEPVYHYETDPRKRIIVNISSWASIRELHVISRETRENQKADPHKAYWDSIGSGASTNNTQKEQK
ncbi:MAG: hypothetical protein ACO3CL_06845 [Bacteroidia bacterium]